MEILKNIIRSQLGDKYYFITSFFEVSSSVEQHDEMDTERWERGNYFISNSQAEIFINSVIKKLIELRKS